MEEARLDARGHPSSIRRHLKHVPGSNPRIFDGFFRSSTVSLFRGPSSVVSPFFTCSVVPTRRVPRLRSFPGSLRVISLRFLGKREVSSITDRGFSRRQLADTRHRANRTNVVDACWPRNVEVFAVSRYVHDDSLEVKLAKNIVSNSLYFYRLPPVVRNERNKFHKILRTGLKKARTIRTIVRRRDDND